MWLDQLKRKQHYGTKLNHFSALNRHCEFTNDLCKIHLIVQAINSLSLLFQLEEAVKLFSTRL